MVEIKYSALYILPVFMGTSLAGNIIYLAVDHTDTTHSFTHFRLHFVCAALKPLFDGVEARVGLKAPAFMQRPTADVTPYVTEVVRVAVEMLSSEAAAKNGGLSSSQRLTSF